MNLPSIDQLDRELARRSFAEFVRQAWPIIEPGIPLQWNWHMDAVCDHLQAVHEGKMRDLIINIPYRLSKSVLVSILYPCWVWLSKPGHKFLCTSHSHSLVLVNAQKARQVIVSPWYCDFFPEGKLHLTSDTQQVMVNQYGGLRYSFSVGSKVLGLSCNSLIIDDPMTTESAYSAISRNAVSQSIGLDFMSRLTPPGQGNRIIVMQRLHHDDTSGKYLEDPDWDRLIIPALWEGDHRSRTALNFVDPRTEIGESIFPSYFTKKKIDRDRIENGNQFYASQLQQHPVSVEGSIIHYDWIKYYKELPAVKKYSISCDTAIKTGQHNDYSVIMLWAECENGYYLVEMVRKKLEYTALKHLIKAFYDANPASEMIIEDKASGQQLVQDFKSFSRIPIVAVIPGRDMPLRKDERLQMVASLFEAGKVHIPEEAAWKLDFTREVCEFGFHKTDDIVDAMTQYLSRVLSRRNRSNVRML